MTKPAEEALRRILAQKDVLQRIDQQIAQLESDSESIFDDQQRLRENMKSLKGSSEEKALLLRYPRQLNEQETRLTELRKQKQTLEGQKAIEETKLNHLIDELSFDVAV